MIEKYFHAIISASKLRFSVVLEIFLKNDARERFWRGELELWLLHTLFSLKVLNALSADRAE